MASTEWEKKAADELAGEGWSSRRTQFYRDWAAVEPERAILHALSSNPDAPGLCAQLVLQQWLADDWDKAVAFVGDCDEGPVKELLNGTIVERVDPARFSGTREWVEARMKEPSGGGIAGVFAVKWLETDPAAAADWVMARMISPDSSGPVSRDFQSFMAVWAARDAVGAGGYLREMPHGRARDVATLAFAPLLVAEDHDLALGWANSIDDEGLREGALKAVEEERMKLAIKHDSDSASGR